MWNSSLGIMASLAQIPVYSMQEHFNKTIKVTPTHLVVAAKLTKLTRSQGDSTGGNRGQAVWLPQRLKVTHKLHLHLEHNSESRHVMSVLEGGSCPALLSLMILTAQPCISSRRARCLLWPRRPTRGTRTPGRREL
ncbi:hypothetical protein GWK47_016732 [Chionoecetes opilio]|uniref:Uncharacterized protein n=1 Tax=Chionoecetes opilio TaxID=41210 RepID=A0A8J4XWH6_CHIOP|nr:hypothetical protein GWK47_016732 [Chionoecetes opilio]